MNQGKRSIAGRRGAMASLAVALTAAMAGGPCLAAGEARVRVEETISHAQDAIHHVVVIDASPAQVYAALTDARQFDQFTRLSADLQAGMKLGSEPTAVSPEAGGTFTLFGGHIVGRHLELVPNRRIAQAWRVVNWKPGVYSLAVFELTAQDKGTRIVFDHTGFPQGQAAHLAEGWKGHYWEPLQRFLAPPADR